MNILKLKGTIAAVTDLSPTAREYTLTLSEPMPFVAGAFVNFFFEHEGEKIRRAFSMSSSDTDHNQIALSIRLSADGQLTPIMWGQDLVGTEVDLMGPMGLNTADKFTHPHIVLVGYGVGAGVVKSLADHLVHREDVRTLTIFTGNRSVDEILHKDFFDELAAKHDKVKVTYVVSDKDAEGQYPVGYVQDHLVGLNFDNTDVYTCGQKVACESLVETVESTKPTNCTFLVEDFH